MSARARGRIARSTMVQLALFAVVAIGCTSYVGIRVLDADPFGGTFGVTVYMPETGGLTPTSDVTYRGSSVGTVRSVRIAPGSAGVVAELDIERGNRIPASSRAVVTMDTPVAIQSLDLRPPDASPPYLRQGSTIRADRTSRPLPLEKLLVGFMRFADTVDTEALRTVADELSTGLSGSTGDLRQIMRNAGTLMDTLSENRPALINLARNGKSAMDIVEQAGTDLPEIAASMRALTDQLREQKPAIESALDTAPEVADRLVPLLRQNRPAVPALLGNLVSTSQIMVTRTPALDQLLVSMPRALDELAGIEHGGVAQFYLLAAQGPACYYPNQRRPPTDTAPRQARTDLGCSGDQPGAQQRGAANAPRPPDAGRTQPGTGSQPSGNGSQPSGNGSQPSGNGSAERGRPMVNTYDPETGRTLIPGGKRIRLGSTGGQDGLLGARSWYALFLQGIR